LATDALLADAITQLTQLPNSALLYVSDHGESLGENGIYLHGLPYWMAPKAQTAVPLIWWMSPSFASNQALNLSCLQQKKQQPLSHDHLFHSLPALFARASSAFKAELNLFASCTAV
jgi:lipid A ethanolaminephosphotransferase